MHALARKLRNGNKQNGDTTVPVDLLEAAEDAGLRYVTDEQPGFSRKRKGEEFEYSDTTRESRLLTNSGFCASNGSLFRRRGVMSGFAPRLMDISRPSDATRADGSNIDITSAGGKYAIRTSTIG